MMHLFGLLIGHVFLYSRDEMVITRSIITPVYAAVVVYILYMNVCIDSDFFMR
jgi:hypothetical protein